MNQNGLKRVLRINAGFSALSGLAMIVTAADLSDWFTGAHPWILRGIGIGLLLFAADLFVSARGSEISRGKALYFSISDFGWVAGSVVLLALLPMSATAAGTVAGVALIVAGFGAMQLRCLRGGSAHSA